MDIWFTLFVFTVGLSIAVGLSLLLVGYVSAMPSSFAHGPFWLRMVGIFPLALIGIPFFAAALLNVFGQALDPIAIAKWAAIPAFSLHLAALGGFLYRHWHAHRKQALQLLIGLALAALALALLYGLGPHFVDRMPGILKGNP